MGPWSRTVGLVLIAILISGAFAACQDDSASGSGVENGLLVVASTSIPAALAKEVGGDALQVETLIPPGTDPHSFDVSPGDLRTIADADLVLLIGLELDDFLLDTVESGNDSADVIVVTEGIELLEAGEDHEHDDDGHEEHQDQEQEDLENEEHDEADHEAAGDDHDHGEFDPHVWQDPLRVKVMVENIADALAEVDPDNASTYRDNAAAYQTTLDDTHVQIQSMIDEIPVDDRKLVTNHDAFAYFADRYGLDVIGTIIPSTSSEADPSAGNIAELTELIEEEGVRAIFAEALIAPQVAESLASDTGVQIVDDLYSGQVGEAGSDAETVHDMLLANATKISEALQ